jgi:hypothetical protein
LREASGWPPDRNSNQCSETKEDRPLDAPLLGYRTSPRLTANEGTGFFKKYHKNSAFGRLVDGDAAPAD